MTSIIKTLKYEELMKKIGHEKTHSQGHGWLELLSWSDCISQTRLLVQFSCDINNKTTWIHMTWFGIYFIFFPRKLYKNVD